MFIAQIIDAQDDIIDLFSPYMHHYFTGRQNLTLYDSKAGYKWKQCIRQSSVIHSEQISGSIKLQQRYSSINELSLSSSPTRSTSILRYILLPTKSSQNTKIPKTINLVII
ncbi:unnamed protein product [Brugia timori]|uniref:Nuclear transport factor 2 family protein n=1 Tax=Brugia timori TaxID=42155 RepID=A0A0R3RAA8_9BILA|nr:unnamed protein product [Brugia timori]